MSTFLLDFRQSFRSMLRAPGFLVAAVLTLALGIGATVTMFSAIHELILKPLPYPSSERMVMLRINHKDDSNEVISIPNALDLREGNISAEALTVLGAVPEHAELAGREGPESIQVGRDFWNAFAFLGARPVAGTLFTEEQERKQEPLVLLSHKLWMRHFGGDPKAVGQSLQVDGKSFTVVGVLPAGLAHPAGKADLYQLLDIQAQERGRWSFLCVARLKTGMSAVQATADFNRVWTGLTERYPDMNTPGSRLSLVPLKEWVLGDQSRSILLLMGASALLLCVACVNVAQLFLARTLRRTQEVAVRSALGAGLRGLFQKYLAEGLLVGLLGSALGTLLAAWGVRGLPSLLPGSQGLVGLDRLGLNGSVLGFALLLALLTSVFFALAPAIQARKLNLNQALREGSRQGTSGGRRTRGVLILVESALSVLLLIASGLFLRSFAQAVKTDPGFDPKGLATFRLSLPKNRYENSARILSFHNELLRRMKALPGVSSATTSRFAPLSTGYGSPRWHEAPTEVPMREWSRVSMEKVGAYYFETLKAPILQGRGILESDQLPGQLVAVINEHAARQMFPGRNPIGQRVVASVGIEGISGNPTFEIVGLVKDLRLQSLTQAPGAQVFFAFPQLTSQVVQVYLRTGLSAVTLRKAVEAQVRELDPSLPLRDFTSVEALAQTSLADRRQTAILLGIFAGLSLLLSSLGIAGVVSYAVNQRTREIGVRAALGALPSRIAFQIARSEMRLVATGLALGLGLALAGAKLLASQLYGIQPLDPSSFLVATFLMAAVSALACWIPSLRAAHLDPVQALRSE